MLHIRRKAEIQNLGNINASVRGSANCLEGEAQGSSQGEHEEAGPDLAAPAATSTGPISAGPSAAPTSPLSASLPLLSPDGRVMTDSMSDTSPAKLETRGLYAYVKTRILQLL